MNQRRAVVRPASRGKESLKSLRVRAFKAGDASRVASLIRRTLLVVNSKSYSPRVIAELTRLYSAPSLLKRARAQRVLVAVTGERVVGTVSLARDGWLSGMFVDSRAQGRGVGTRLIQALVRVAERQGSASVRGNCSTNSAGFYRRAGFTVGRPVQVPKLGRAHPIRLALRRGGR